MRGLRLLRWSGSVSSRRLWLERPPHLPGHTSRTQATAAAVSPSGDNDSGQYEPGVVLSEEVLTQLPSPPISAAQTSSKLSALHARLSLPKRLPIESLARTLVDPSADPSPKFNNHAFSVLGSDLLAFYTSEYILSQYPRLPLPVVYAAMYAYVGPKALSVVTREWGVERVGEPGGEVDPGYLQFQAVPPTQQPLQARPNVVSSAPEGNSRWRRSLSSRTVYDDEFGDMRTRAPAGDQQVDTILGITLEAASANFVRAVIGAVYLHAGRSAAKQFYQNHFMSRSLDMSKLFQFKHPTKDLSRLCAREGFQSPVARIESETGRKSRHPVFVVGVYSGNDKLGEGVGAGLDEARIRAAVAALKGWYLYSPLEVRLPSEMEEANARPWAPLMVDQGEIVS